MAQAANITCNDGAATPVPHVFVPVRASEDAVEYREDVEGVPIQQQYTYTLKVEKTSKAGLRRNSQVFKLPYLEGDVLKFGMATLVLTYPEDAPSTIRRDLRVMTSNIVTYTQPTDALSKSIMPL